MEFINLTPHAITIKNGTTDISIPPSGDVANIEFETVWKGKGEEHLFERRSLLDVAGLPEEIVLGIVYIVSMPTLMAIRASGFNRDDIYCPITRGEGVVRNDRGHVISSPGLWTM